MTFADLTPRESTIAKAIALGVTNREIATALSISIKTVDSHRAHIMSKLDVRNNVGLARRAIAEGAVPAPTVL